MEILNSVKTKLGNTVELIGEPGENNILIIGVVHGDEPQGKFLIEEYLTPSPHPSPSRGEGARLKSYFNSLPTCGVGQGQGRGGQDTLARAKELRKNSTDAEKKLWSILRANQLNGLHFKRQQPIGKYIVDFICFSKRLIIELDGGQHNTDIEIERDNERTRYLNKCGYKVIRIWNDQVLKNPEGTIEYILNSLPTCGGGLGRGGRNSLLFIPCLNPDGMARGTRTNANGVDLNRNFPTKNWGENKGENATCDDETTNYYGGKSPASEIETQFLIDTIKKYSPTLVLTLHTPYKVVNYDGDAKEIAKMISDIIKYPVEASIGYPTPGSFGTYCGVERNIPTITLEMDEKCPVEELIDPIFKIFDTLTYL